MSDRDPRQTLAAAEAIASIAHRGQVDKAGMPYIEHPRRVANSIPRNGDDDLDAVSVAWLHDVIEDTDITRDDLHAAGIPWSVIEDVELLTRRDGQAPEEYYAAITMSPRALAVKLADIADNTNPERVALLDEATVARLREKYATARRLLGVD